MGTNHFNINAKTGILELIKAYHHLEDVLIQYVPAFKKLKNPLLRNTIARIATLQQAAIIGKVKIKDLVSLLRKESGRKSICPDIDSE